jgi:hypothetical protein
MLHQEKSGNPALKAADADVRGFRERNDGPPRHHQLHPVPAQLQQHLRVQAASRHLPFQVEKHYEKTLKKHFRIKENFYFGFQFLDIFLSCTNR